ncbi:DUF2970 domain-containing protein [Candidatus Persebacteraceae bacterium Df01]|uniref:DUF2970 domain-containing protein n=1 Tax=Candidatus Doriopsillibacter californiensis TaxID=2970740 RepID=A0ABT7QJR0_9GAMM|nr:DUF2970 domain-containing protein [Candidatus Persebacteraceae bacterium Df01]
MKAFLLAAKTVIFAFFGVRRKNAAATDWNTLKPHHVIIAGIFMAALFIAIILTVVDLIV